jgi:hypothetical protein
MAEIWFDVDAALSEVPINVMPLLDDTDFKSKEESVAYNAAGLDLVWNFVTTAGALTQTAVTPTDTGGNYDWVNQGNGMYTIEIPASGGATINNDTEGFGWFTGVATGILPWRGPIIGFRAAGLNNALIDSAYSTTRGLAGTALPDAAADAAGGLPISDAGGLDLDAQIKTDIDAILVDTSTTLDDLVDGLETMLTDIHDTDLPAVKSDTAAILADTGTDGVVLKAAGLDADAVAEIQSGLALEATLTAIKGAGWTTETLKALADAILNLDGDVADVFDDVGDVKAELDLVHAKTNNLPTDPADQSAVELAITNAVTSVKGADADTLKVLSDQIDGISAGAIADAVWDEALAGHAVAGSAGDTLANIDVSGVADAVWDELLAGHVIAGSAGKTLGDIDPDALADAVYDELVTIPAVSLGVPTEGEMEIYIADALHVTISDLGTLANVSKLYVSFKERYEDTDAESILQLEESQGLLVVNGATATATDGSITIDDAVAGDITLDVAASVMDDIDVKTCVYDVKVIRTAGVAVQTLHQGKVHFHRAVTKAVS